MEPFQKIGDFFSRLKLLKYKKGEVLLRPGDIPQGVYLLNKGYVRLYSISEKGEELTLIIFKPQDFFPAMWAINNTPQMEYLEAMTDIELYRASREDFLDFLTLNSDVFLEFTKRILYRFGGVLKRMEYLVFGDAYQKVASIILICAQRFGQKKDNRVMIQVPLTHKDIAALVGITRETASVEIKKLERKDIISHQGRFITIGDMDKLQKESLLITD